MKVYEMNREQRNELVACHSGLINRLATALTSDERVVAEVSMWVGAAVRIPQLEGSLDNVFWLLDAAATAQGPNRKVRTAANVFRTMLVEHRQSWTRQFSVPDVH